jgi:hypothetical protein
VTENIEKGPLSRIADRITQHPGMYAVVAGVLDLHEETGDKGWAVCPYHPDKTPSLAIYRNDGHVYCFACRKHRSSIGVIMDRLDRKFPAAMEYILERLDVSAVSGVAPAGGSPRPRGDDAVATRSGHRPAVPDRIRVNRELTQLVTAADNARGTDREAQLRADLRGRMGDFLTAASAKCLADDLSPIGDDPFVKYRPFFQPLVGVYRDSPLDVVNRCVQDFFVGNLAGERGGVARRYLQERKIPGWVAERYGIGYCLDERGVSQISEALADLVSLEQLVAAGVCRETKKPDDDGRHRKFSLFAGRLTLPISDRTGRIVAFSGRDLTGSSRGKYVNSPETEVFHKGDHLYGFHHARSAISRHGSVIVVEGYADVWALAMAGIDNAVATMGTALTAAQAQVLAKCGKVYLAFDRDEAGQRASIKSFETLLTHGSWPYVLDANWAGKDPGDYIGGDMHELAEAAVIGAQDAYPLYRDWIAATDEAEQVRVLELVGDPWAYAMLRYDFVQRDVALPPEPRLIGGFALR